MNRSRKLAKPNLRSLRYDPNVLYTYWRPGFRQNHRVFDVLNVPDQADFANIDLLQARLDETAARIAIVVGELLLHLGKAQPVGDQLVRIHALLVYAPATT